MKISEKAAAWAEGIAADNARGYDQGRRWGPDYDCSSLVIGAYKAAGLALTATYTGDMRRDFLARGFRDVTNYVNLSTGAGLCRGDVLLNERSHTALYTGSGRLVHAAGNEYGGATGGRTGDQTGREIGAAAYFNFPWDCVLRYEGEEDAPEPASAPADGAGTYTVQPGDSLWSIAERTLGSGFLYPRLQELNGLTDTALHPGQILRLRAGGKEDGKKTADGEKCAPALPVLREGMSGPAVAAAQTLLLLRGAALPQWGADGDFGAETASALAGFSGGETVDGPAWERLIG